MPKEPQSILSSLNRNLEKPFLVIGLLAMILIISYQTFFRYVLSVASFFVYDGHASEMVTSFIDIAAAKSFLNSIVGGSIWTEELSRYLFIWISYLAVPLALMTRGSIRVDMVFKLLPERLRNIGWVAIDCFLLVLVVAFCWMGFGYAQMQMANPQLTPAMRIPYYVPYAILPLGFGLMALRTLQDLWVQARTMPWLDIFDGFAFASLILSPVLLFDDLNPIALLFGYFLAFLILGVPIAFSLGLAGMATVLGAGTLPVNYLVQIAFTSIDSFPIMAIPFFIAAGIFMGAGGLSRRLLDLGDELVGALPGGMALASIMTCIFFASISGSGPATVAAIGTITIPAMIQRGYNTYFAAAVVAAAGCIGVMIPPSNPFVVYGVAGQASVGKLFLAGITPGLLCGLVLMLVTYIIARKNGWKGQERERSLATLFRAVWTAKWALFVPVIILGGIYKGLMTPTEAAAVAALYGLCVGMFVYRELSLASLWQSCIEAAQTSSIIIVLMAMATIFGNIMTIEQVPENIAEFILSLTQNKIILLLLINIFLLLVGTFMEALAAIVIITPILLPLVVKVGVDPVHFGVIMVVNLAIGFITPPVGVNLFVASGIAKARMENIVLAIWPFLLVLLAVLVLVTYVPAISLWLV